MKRGELRATDLFIIITFLAACVLSGIVYVYPDQQSAVVSAEVHLKPVSLLMIDGLDPGWGLEGGEVIELGNLDSRGTAISGAASGDPAINGISGIPVDAAGSPLSSPLDPECIGSFYSFFPGVGRNSNNQHPDSAICIFLMTYSRWRITTSAQLISSTPGVSVGQLKWKMDDIPGKGFQNYIDYSSSETTVASGFGAGQYFYLDLGLLVEFDDASGPNTWILTYTLITD